MLHRLSLWWGLLGLAVILVALDLLVFTLAARRARTLAARGQTAQAVRLLKWTVRLPSIRGEGTKLEARYSLGMLLESKQDFAGAAAQWGKLLRFLRSYGWKNLHGLEAEVRMHLADCLEALGQPEDAAQERTRAQGSLAGRAPTLRSLLSQGALFKQQGKHAVAYTAFEQGLGLVKPNAKSEQGDVMALLAVAAYRTGRPDLVVLWAERAIENGASGTTGIGCRRMAGYGYLGLGDLDRAERCYHQALEAASAAGNAQEEAGTRSFLAGIMRLRGSPAEAMQECRAVITAFPAQAGFALLEYAECLHDLGQFDKALDVMRQAQNAPGSELPSEKRHGRAMLALHMAVTASTAARSSDALALLREAAVELGRDERAGMSVSAVGAWVYAQLGQRENSEAQTQAVLRASPRFADDRASLMLAYSSLARAAFALGDWERSQEFWTLYFAQKPNPNGLPVGYYFQGECALALGHDAEARAAFQEAQTVNPEIYYARLAQRRLDEMTA